MLTLGLDWKPYWESLIILYNMRISGTLDTFVHAKF